MEAIKMGEMPVNFNDNNGNLITGVNLFLAFKDPQVKGYRTEKFFVKSDIKVPEVKVNETLIVNFNFKGKIESIDKA